MHSLPLFHRIAGQPVIVLGTGEAAEAKRRLVQRAGGQLVGELQPGIDAGARLAFIAHADPTSCEADAIRARCAGLLVNVVDRPELCDFTTPSVLERGPVLLAIGTGGASAGLAKTLRLRLETLLPASLAELAEALSNVRARLRARFPDAGARRRALDAALAPGAVLDPLDAASAGRVEGWIEQAEPIHGGVVEIHLRSPDPEDLTLREARLLGSADVLAFEPGVSDTVLNRARADAARVTTLDQLPRTGGLIVVLRSS